MGLKDAQKLLFYGKKTITKEQLGNLYSKTDDMLLYPVIDALRKEGALEPVKTSKTNGNQRYPIFLKYRIILPENSFDKEREEIQKLHPMLQRNGILSEKPAEYAKYRNALQMLDAYLFSGGTERIPVSRKERSFEIFGEEKLLDDSSFCKLLEKIGLGKEELGFYDTPEYCFNDFIPEKKKRMQLLICENKDIWFNIRRRMFEDGADILFDTPIDGVVYGCGNKISQTRALTSYTEFMKGTEVSYLYWGDIDRAGLNIYLSLVKNNPQLDIRLFLPAYEEMLFLSRERSIPDSADKREVMGDYDSIYGLFSKEACSLLKESIGKNKRIPQEIITYERLLYKMR